MVCYRCGTNLSNTNSSKEHIIPNACGGRLKAPILCITCNSVFGHDIDNALTEQNNDLANLLLIKRERGEPQPIHGKRTSTGEAISIEHDGRPRMNKPSVEQKDMGDRIEVSITARDLDEMKRILKGFKRKYKHFDVDSALSMATKKEEYLDDRIHFEVVVGGDAVLRSIAKLAMGYFICQGGNRRYISHLLPYVETGTSLNIVTLYYPTSAIYTPVGDEVSHVIRLVANPTEKTLYAYVELFNTRNFLILLSTTYSGAQMNKTYVYDVIKNLKRDRTIPLNYNAETLNQIFSQPQMRATEELGRRFQRVLEIAMKRQDDNHRNRLLERAIQNSLGKYPDGIPITPEMANEAVRAIMQELTPWILRHIN